MYAFDVMYETHSTEYERHIDSGDEELTALRGCFLANRVFFEFSKIMNIFCLYMIHYYKKVHISNVMISLLH